MKWLYIGQYSEGTTSRMRAEKLESLLVGWKCWVVDVHKPFYSTNRVFRTFGFRFKKGPLIKRISEYVASHLQDEFYDLIWVDKGVFLSKRTVEKLKGKAKILVHFTPDTAFFENRSFHFFDSMDLYDFLITTKSFEWDLYGRMVPEAKLIFATQGYDPDVHRPMRGFGEKEDAVAFVGLHEKDREETIRFLLENKIKVKLAGFGWKRFAEGFNNSNFLDYKGESVFGKEYAELISSCKFGLGCLSKRFPEKHTTRTFEIPACGTALLTEKNDEIANLFCSNEVVYFSSLRELCDKIYFYYENPGELSRLIARGEVKVWAAGFQYESILKKVLETIFCRQTAKI